MNADEIRQVFLSFFAQRGHLIIPSAPLVPQGDPTLLFTSAGMVPFKPYFLGEATPPHPRLASCQKCFRTSDIEAVGDNIHLTFFEMLGNFSIGDYFKREAIAWAWEFVTQHLYLDPARLWITIYREDDEAYDIWRREIHLPDERILRMGEDTNFWGPAGDSGPCGPCSEIHYDFGPEAGCGRPDCRPGCECGRYSELWNLVFTQYNQHQDGTRTPLARPNIDTGMGLERVATVMQGQSSLYDTDLFQPLIQRLASICAVPYGVDRAKDHSMRIIAEHSRAFTFLIADGVLPANEGRGYVLRRIIRRAALMERELHLEEPFLDLMAGEVISLMQAAYPELSEREEFIKRIVRAEEERFGSTLASGMEMLQGIISRLKGNIIPGIEAFILYDTYGFPLELTTEVARRYGLKVDRIGFEEALAQQRGRARSQHQFAFSADKTQWVKDKGIKPTTFVGYDRLEERGRVVAILLNNMPVEEVTQGDNAGVILDKTPFYAEKGGQVGDRGRLYTPAGSMSITDTTYLTPEVEVHWGRVISGAIKVGDEARAEVDAALRKDIARNHSATHLLQAALRQVVGEHVFQQGSLVNAEGLRFDFTHLEPLTPDEIRAVNRQVNHWIREDLEVFTRLVTYQEALKAGAMALFEGKYADTVRLIQIGEPPVSAELCGGTHVGRSGEIGLFWIVAEEGIGAGLRRIEAKTGRGAEEFVEGRLQLLGKLAQALKADPEHLLDSLTELRQSLEEAEREKARLEREMALQAVEGILHGVEDLDGIKVVTAELPPVSREAMREVADRIREKLGSGVIALGTTTPSGVLFITAVTPDLVAKGYHAGKLAQLAAREVGGGGGGRPTLGEGGGHDHTRLRRALELVKKSIAER